MTNRYRWFNRDLSFVIDPLETGTEVSAYDLLLLLFFVYAAPFSQIPVSIEFWLGNIPPSAISAHEVVLFALEVNDGGTVRDAARLLQGPRKGFAAIRP